MAISIYSRAYLTGVVRNILPPAAFLQNLLFPRQGMVHETVPTETIELSSVTAGRTLAPFIKKNGEAVIVGGVDQKFSSLQGPNIRIKQPHLPHETFGRKAGSLIHATSTADLERAQRQKVIDDLDVMANTIVNRKEWMVSSLLQNSISYSIEGYDNFTITLPRDAGNTITLGTFWDAAPTTVNVEEDFRTAAKVVSDAEGYGLTDVIHGAESGQAFLDAMKAQGQTLLDPRRMATGSVIMDSLFDQMGVTYLGRFSQMDHWIYDRQFTLPAEEGGGTYDLIRPKYCEIINRNPAITQRKMFYAAIPDFDNEAAATGRSLRQTEMFSKSWVTQDPSQRWLLMHTRPLPWFKRANSHVSMKTVSG